MFKLKLKSIFIDSSKLFNTSALDRLPSFSSKNSNFMVKIFGFFLTCFVGFFYICIDAFGPLCLVGFS